MAERRGSGDGPERGIRYNQQTFKSRHHRPLTNDQAWVSHFCCLLSSENVNSRLSMVQKKKRPPPHTCPPCPPSIHPAILLLPLLLCSGWSHETGVRVLMEDLMALCASGNNPPIPCSLINQAGFIESGRVL